MEINHIDLVISEYNVGSAWVPDYRGIQIVHIPTRLVVKSGGERSQHRNKYIAMVELKQLIEEQEMSSKQEIRIDMSDNNKDETITGYYIPERLHSEITTLLLAYRDVFEAEQKRNRSDLSEDINVINNTLAKLGEVK